MTTTLLTHASRQFALAATLALGLAAAPVVFAADSKLTGAEEVPPVQTSASGEHTIKVASDGMVTGGVKTQGIEATMAHIHIGAANANGPVIVPLAKGGAGEWMVPAGAKLTGEQMQAYKAGNLYVNVHSEANKGGEIRDQLEP